MNSRSLSPLTTATALLLTIATLPAQASSWRTFVSPNGNDANTATNCGLATPCRQFAAALSVTDVGGEIVVLDSANYGKLAINKSVTISVPPGIYAGISVFQNAAAPADTGIAVTAAGANVTLKGLTINGMGGTYGVAITDGAKVTLDNCTIGNLSGAGQYGIYVNAPVEVRVLGGMVRDNYNGIYFNKGATGTISGTIIAGNSHTGVWANNDTDATTTTVTVADSVVRGGTWGIVGYPRPTTTTGNVRLHVRNTTIVGADAGLLAGTGSASTALGTLAGGMVVGNTYGLSQVGAAATLKSYANTALIGNTTDTAGTVTAATLQ